VSRGDSEVWAEVGHLLGSRQGWSLEAQSTPGSPSTWCFRSGGQAELSVSVVDGAVAVYLMDVDTEVTLADPAALVAWLDTNEVLFASRPVVPADQYDRVLADRLGEWRRQGL
jgi:hypothetical protein